MNIKPIKIVASLIIGFLLYAGNGMAISYDYDINQKTSNSSYSIVLNPLDDGLELTSSSNDHGTVYTAKLDKNYQTIIFNSLDATRSMDITVTRETGSIRVDGLRGGQRINKKYPAGSSPFLHFFNVQLAPFIRSAERRLVFQSLNPDSFEPMEFEATKLATQNIDVMGLPTPVWQVKINLTGLMSIFWSTQVFFRVSDGVFVLDQGTTSDGKPLVSRLVAEHDQ